MTVTKPTAPAAPAGPDQHALQDLLDMGATVNPDDVPVDAEIIEPAASDTGTAVEIHTAPDSLVMNDEWSDVDEMDLSPSDRFTIPLLQLSRKIDGGFVNEDTGDTVREIDAVLMAKVNTRAWWPEAFGKGDAAPSCRSDDSITPNVDRSPAQQPGWDLPAKADGTVPAPSCAACPNSQWDGDNPPPCSESIEFLAFVPTDIGAGKVVRLRFSGLALGPARSYWQSFATRLPKRPPIAYLTHISLDEKLTDNGTFLVPTFRRQLELSRNGAAPILQARDERQLEWRHAISTDERPAEPVATDGEGPFDDEEPF